MASWCLLSSVRESISPEPLGTKDGGWTIPCWSNVIGSPIREGATVTDETNDSPEDTTITGGVVVVAIVEMWDIMNYKNVQE